MLAVLLQGGINRRLIRGILDSGFLCAVCSPRESERELNKFLKFDYFSQLVLFVYYKADVRYVF